MKNPSGNNLEKLIFGMFDQMIEGVDKYVTKQGSTWLIFTEDKRWVIEFTNDKTLWFNFNLFQGELDLIGKDCVEERDLIKNWFESRFLNKPKVKESHHVDVMKFFDKKMENTIENGVKHTEDMVHVSKETVEDTIQNGVKETIVGDGNVTCYGEDAIENGVKNTRPHYASHGLSIEDTIQEGVKDTKENWSASKYQVEDTIENGVRHTIADATVLTEAVEDTIQNGVKETTPSGYLGSIEMKGKIVHQIESPKQNNEVEDTIQNGVKDTKKGLNKQGFLVEDTIQNGVKVAKEDRLFRTIHVMNAIVNGVKHVEDGDWLDQDERIDDIIENGVKETKEISNISLMSEIFKVNAKQAIRDGVKELKELPDKSGEFKGYGDWYRRQGNMTKPHTEYVKEVIKDSYNHMGRVEGVIRNTDKDGI